MVRHICRFGKALIYPTSCLFNRKLARKSLIRVYIYSHQLNYWLKLNWRSWNMSPITWTCNMPLLIRWHSLHDSHQKELDKKLREVSFSVFIPCQEASTIREETVSLYEAEIEGFRGLTIPWTCGESKLLKPGWNEVLASVIPNLKAAGKEVRAADEFWTTDHHLACDLMGTRANDVQWWRGAAYTWRFCYVFSLKRETSVFNIRPF